MALCIADKSVKFLICVCLFFKLLLLLAMYHKQQFNSFLNIINIVSHAKVKQKSLESRIHLNIFYKIMSSFGGCKTWMILKQEWKRRNELTQFAKLRVFNHMVVVFCLNQPIFTHGFFWLPNGQRNCTRPLK